MHKICSHWLRSWSATAWKQVNYLSAYAKYLVAQINLIVFTVGHMAINHSAWLNGWLNASQYKHMYIHMYIYIYKYMHMSTHISTPTHTYIPKHIGITDLVNFNRRFETLSYFYAVVFNLADYFVDVFRVLSGRPELRWTSCALYWVRVRHC